MTDTTIQMDNVSTTQTNGKTVDKKLLEYIADNRTFPALDFKQWWQRNFPLPNRRGYFRMIRAFIAWAGMSFGAYFLVPLPYKYGVTFMVSLIVTIFPPFFPAVILLILTILAVLGLVLGMLFLVLTEWFVVLYNGSTAEPDRLPASLIVFCSLLIWCYFVSWMLAKYFNTPLNAFWSTALVATYLITSNSPNILQLQQVHFTAFYLPLIALIVLLIETLLCFVFFPEHSVDTVRLKMLNVLKLEREFLLTNFIVTDKGKEVANQESIKESQKLYNKILFEQAAIQANVKTSATDMGIMWDQPLLLAGLAKQLSKVTRGLGSIIQSLERGAVEEYLTPTIRPERAQLAQEFRESCCEVTKYVADQLAIIHDALIVHPGILGQFGLTSAVLQGPLLPLDNVTVGDASPSNVAKASRRNLLPMWEEQEEVGRTLRGATDVHMGTVRSNWPKQIGSMLEGMYERREIDHFLGMAKLATFVYSVSILLDDTLLLSNAAKNLYKARGKARFVFPFKGWPKQPKPPKPPKSKPSRSCTTIFNDAVYAFQQHIMSDASHFAVRRVVLFFIIVIWAFIPATMYWFAENNGFWILIAAMLVISPQIGATWPRILIRVGSSLIAVLWALAGFYIAPGNFLVALLWMIPLSIVGFYFYANSTMTYIGLVIGMTYSIVALIGTNDIPRDVWLRAAAQFIAVILCFLASVLIYPNLARTNARITLGKLFFNYRELFQRLMTTPLIEKSELLKSDVFKEGSALFQATQNLLSQTRQVTLYLAAGEPDLDRPYDQGVMEAVAASLQRLLEILAGAFDANLAVRHHADYVHSWHLVRSCWAKETLEFQKYISTFIDSLGNTLIQKTPLPPLSIDLESTVLQMIQALDPKTALERTKAMGYQATEEDAMRIAFAGIMIWSNIVGALYELQRVQDLLVMVYGKATWYNYNDDLYIDKTESLFAPLPQESFGTSGDVEPDLKQD